MSAPAAVIDNAQPISGLEEDLLKERLRKLQPSPLSDRVKEGVEKIAAGVRLKINSEVSNWHADDEIRSGLGILKHDLQRMHKVGDAHRVIGQALGRADGQPARRIAKPPRKKTDAPIREEPTGI
jgi:hypothetical protein